jgi:hypothetical protein
MIALATIIERFGPLYLAKYATSVLPSQRQALNAMKNCRSSLGPGMLAQCGDCGVQRVVPHSCENGQITYRWRDSKTKKTAQRTVSGVEFLRLVLQHVLPKGFRRARNYGLNHRHRRAWIIPGTAAGRVAQKDIFRGGRSAPGSSNKRFRSWLRTI